MCDTLQPLLSTEPDGMIFIHTCTDLFSELEQATTCDLLSSRQSIIFILICTVE